MSLLGDTYAPLTNSVAQIAIVDDTATYSLFADLILAAPQEDILEK